MELLIALGVILLLSNNGTVPPKIQPGLPPPAPLPATQAELAEDPFAPVAPEVSAAEPVTMPAGPDLLEAIGMTEIYSGDLLLL